MRWSIRIHSRATHDPIQKVWSSKRLSSSTRHMPSVFFQLPPVWLACQHPGGRFQKCAVMLNFLAKQIKTKQDVKSLFELVLEAIVSAFIDSSSELMEPQFLGYTNSKRHSSNSSIHAFCNQHTHYVKLEVPQKILFQISNIHITGHWRFAVSKPLPSSSALAQSSATPAMPWEDHFHFRWGWGWGWIWGGFFQWKTGR